MQNKITLVILPLILSVAILCLFLSGCSNHPQDTNVEISLHDLAAANELEALCQRYGSVSYQLKNSSEADGVISATSYWLQDNELVCLLTSNLEGDSDIYYTPTAEFYHWAGTTYVSCPVPGSGISNTPDPPYPNGFLTNIDDNATLENCKKVKDGYEFTITYQYDETISTQCTYTTNLDYVITGCRSISKGENYQESSMLSVDFSPNPMQPPAFVGTDPVTLSLISLVGEDKHTTEITIPRNCLLSVYGTESNVVSWDESGARPLQNDFAVVSDLTLYVH